MKIFGFKDLKYLKEIKSVYIIKEILSLLNERQKLNMIINNKQLQKIFGINIENYKNINGNYKEGERNGKGKEYNIYNDELIFEGE